MNEKFTKKQHYIPQVYLRGFAPEYKTLRRSNVSNEKHTIFQYEIGSERQIERSVPIKSVCYQECLYETPNKDGEYINPNWLENVFSKLEVMFSEYRDKLERKAYHEENFIINCFLDRDEKAFWVTYLALQILRLPQLLNTAQEEAKKLLNNDSFADEDINGFVRMYCLPLFSEIHEDSKEAIVFNAIIKPMFSMNMAVGVDFDGKLITSDKTVYIYTKEYPCDEYEEVIFPISASICLILLGGEKKKQYRHNVLFPIDKNARDYICGAIASTAFEKIYSNHLLSKQERRIIEGSREEVE